MSDTGNTSNQAERARTQLNRVTEELDEITVARLRAGRKRAVAGARVSRRYTGWWLPMSAAAAIVAVTLTTQWWRAPMAPAGTANDIELLATMEGPELLDDIDFYRWIEEQRDAG